MEKTMINNSKQNWTIGQTVKVGFMTLVVRQAIATPGDYAPDVYILSNQANTQLYKFVPHNGCSKITIDEAKEMIADAKCNAEMIAHQALQNAVLSNQINAVFA